MVINFRSQFISGKQFCTRRRAATAASLLGRNGRACGFNSARCGRGLSHENSKGYKCWTSRSMRDFPERNTAPLTTPSVPTMRFSTMPSGHLPLFLSSACTITTNVTDSRCVSLSGYMGTVFLAKAAQVLL